MEKQHSKKSHLLGAATCRGTHFVASGYNEEKAVDSDDIEDDREILSIAEIESSRGNWEW